MGKITKELITRNLPYRIMLAILVLIPVMFIYDFYDHFYYHLSGELLMSTITQKWHIVILNIVFFISFLIPLSFRRKVNWKEYGLVVAFFVSLFIEMYGVPLTVLFASKYFSPSSAVPPNTVFSFTFLGVDIGMSLAMIYGTLLMVIGMVLIIMGWITLYRNIKPNEIVTNGIYSVSRHPQYFGFILIVIGWLVGWPTILTIIFAPILIYMYLRVSKKEEKELSSVKEYEAYKEEVPFFI